MRVLRARIHFSPLGSAGGASRELSLGPRHPNFLCERHSTPPRRKTRSEAQSREDANGLSSETTRTRSGKSRADPSDRKSLETKTKIPVSGFNSARVAYVRWDVSPLSPCPQQALAQGPVPLGLASPKYLLQFRFVARCPYDLKCIRIMLRGIQLSLRNPSLRFANDSDWYTE